MENDNFFLNISKKYLFISVFILFQVSLNAQIKISKYALSQQVGISSFKYSSIWGGFNPYYDYNNTAYFGTDFCLIKNTTASNFSLFTSLGVTKNGFEARAFEDTLTIENILYRKENWSTFNIYNLRTSLGFYFYVKNNLSLKGSLMYVKELSAIEVKQEVLLSDMYGADIFRDTEPAIKHTDFRKNNFYGSISCNYYLTDRISLGIGTNIGLNSIIHFEKKYFIRPFEYHSGLEYHF
jgi:hypothetical protein